MKKIKYFLSSLILIVFAIGCSEEKYDDLSALDSVTSPSNIEAIFDITDDNSGDVTITPSGQAASNYKVHFGDTTLEPALVAPGSKIVHKYAEGEYTVKVEGVAFDGSTSETTFPLSVVYRAPEALEVTFTKTGYVLKVEADADYAASYLVFFGDDANEVGTPLEAGGEVTHDYGGSGTFNVKVIALSGGAAETELISEVTMFDPYLLPIDFENPFVDYIFFTFGGGQQFTKEANPDASGINTSATVGRFRRGWEDWSGVITPVLDAPMDFSAGDKMRIMVYNPDPVNIGKLLKLELQAGTIDNGIANLVVPVTTSGQWEELVFDYGPMIADGTIPGDTTMTRFVLRFNRGTNGDFATLYVDDIRFTN